jgi:hypothetical protein
MNDAMILGQAKEPLRIAALNVCQTSLQGVADGEPEGLPSAMEHLLL